MRGYVQKFLVVNTKATIASTKATTLIPHRVNFLVLVSVIEGYRIVPASKPIANPFILALQSDSCDQVLTPRCARPSTALGLRISV